MASVALTESFVCDRLEEDSVDESVILNGSTFLETKKDDQDTKSGSTKMTKTAQDTKEDAKLFSSDPRFLANLPPRTFRRHAPTSERNRYRYNNNNNNNNNAIYKNPYTRNLRRSHNF